MNSFLASGAYPENLHSYLPVFFKQNILNKQETTTQQLPWSYMQVTSQIA